MMVETQVLLMVSLKVTGAMKGGEVLLESPEVAAGKSQCVQIGDSCVQVGPVSSM